MNVEDYSKYYIQGSDHYLIPKDVFIELFSEMENWKEDTKKYKEVIDKAIEYLEAKKIREKAIVDIDVLEGILKEVSEWTKNVNIVIMFPSV